MRECTPALRVADRLTVPAQAAQDRSVMGLRRQYATVMCGVLPDGLGVCHPVRLPGRWCTVRVIHVPIETTTIGLTWSPM
jgi:hypothetical protein